MQLLIKLQRGGYKAPVATLLIVGTLLLFQISSLLAQTPALNPAGTHASLRKLPGHVPAAVTQLPAIDSVPASQVLGLAISLPVPNPQQLDGFLRELYDPTSPNFRRFLTPDQFTERFGPEEQSYEAVKAFASSNHLTIKATHPNRLVLDVSGTAADIERAFHFKLRVYNHPNEKRTFYAPDVEPSVEQTLPVLHISGLDNYSIPRPKYKPMPRTPDQPPRPLAGSGPSGTFAGNDFRKAYVPGTTLTGAGQNVGLLQFDGYYLSDITAYKNQIGMTGSGPQLINVPVDGGVSSPGSGNGEVALDIEMVISMAPGVSKIYVYEAKNPSPWVDLLSKMANDNLARQLSCSWGGGGPDPASENIFKQMAAQGQSFFNATGDSDAFIGAVAFPSESPNITQVGGTTLTTDGSGAWSSETVWNWGRGTGSSGGISTSYSIPIWQQGISMTSNQGSTTMRNIPDVSLTADNVFTISDNGSRGSVGGTSCAAPLWAGFAALVNQKASMAGLPPVGFLNPALYAIGKASNYNACFHDTVSGNNTWTRSRSKFFAATGYDLCTGLGTPAGANLINTLVPDPIVPVIASFGGSPTTGAAPLEVTFADNSSGNINARGWDFGDGTVTNMTATNFTFVYSSPGVYDVRLTASGPTGTNALLRAGYIVVTNSAQIVASNMPSILAEPQNQTVVAGSDATFNLQVGGSQPFTFQWRFNSNDIPGASGLSYLRTNVQASDAGYYDVIVSNAFGSAISSNARLVVVSRPVLLSPGLSSNGVFTFILSGDAGFSYAIEGTTNFSDWSVIATLPNLAGLVPFVETNSSGSFQAYRARLIP